MNHGHPSEKPGTAPPGGPDLLLDDSALVYHTSDGLYILTGCSHSGICNIIEYAKTLFPDRPVLGVIGGFHLFQCDQRLQDTIAYFQAQNLQHLYPCHCVSFRAKAEMHRGHPHPRGGRGVAAELVTKSQVFQPDFFPMRYPKNSSALHATACRSGVSFAHARSSKSVGMG